MRSSLFAQVQSSSFSGNLIRAGVLLAVYEYAHGKPDSAFASITGCARMAYAAGIRQHAKGNCEEANTWWAVVIYERYA